MRYELLKAFVLLVLMTVYLLFTFTLAVAYHSGGYVVLSIDKFKEGLIEVVVLFSLTPLLLYVVYREVVFSLKRK